MLYKTFVAPFEASIIDPQGSVDIEDHDHDLQAEKKTKTPPSPPPPAPRQTAPAKPAKAQPPARPCTPYGIKRNRQVWEDYWIIKMGVRKNDVNDDGTPKYTMENMWENFGAEIKLLF